MGVKVEQPRISHLAYDLALSSGPNRLPWTHAFTTLLCTTRTMLNNGHQNFYIPVGVCGGGGGLRLVESKTGSFSCSVDGRGST